MTGGGSFGGGCVPGVPFGMAHGAIVIGIGRVIVIGMGIFPFRVFATFVAQIGADDVS